MKKNSIPYPDVTREQEISLGRRGYIILTSYEFEGQPGTEVASLISEKPEKWALIKVRGERVSEPPVAVNAYDLSRLAASSIRSDETPAGLRPT